MFKGGFRFIESAIQWLLCLLAVLSTIITVFPHVNDPLIVGRWVGTGFSLVSLMAYMLVSCILFFCGFKSGTSLQTLANQLCIALGVMGPFVAVWGLLQFLGVVGVPPGVPFRVVAGFDNPAGLSTALAVSFPFAAMKLKATGKCRFFLPAIFIFYEVVILAAQSRTGVLALAFCYMSVMICRAKKVSFKVLPVLLLSLIPVAVFSMIKTGSNAGRSFILKVCMRMVKEHPLLGFGVHGFRENYMLYQAEHLKLPEFQDVSFLADNVTHPLNEYILLLVNFGIVGFSVMILLVVLLARFCFNSSKNAKTLSCSLFVCVAVLSLLSYPFKYPITVLALLVCCGQCLLERNVSDNIRTAKCAIVVAVLLSLAMVSAFVPWAQRQIEWGKSSCLPQDGRVSKYEGMYDIMKHDPYFVYDYSCLSFDNGNYSKATDLALQSFSLYPNYQTALLLADSYLKQNDFVNSEIFYKLASDMCPAKFIPLYGLFELYDLSGKKQERDRVGREILTRPMKVNSKEVRQIRQAVRQRMVDI